MRYREAILLNGKRKFNNDLLAFILFTFHIRQTVSIVPERITILAQLGTHPQARINDLATISLVDNKLSPFYI